MNSIRNLLLIALFVFGSCGCSSVELFRRGEDIDQVTDDNPAVRCVALWTSAEGHGLKDEPSRGFAGQLYFFPKDGEEPVRVDGDVRVYVFDDQGTKEDRVRPIHQFDFSADAWNTYLYDSQFGPCYQLFVPYTRAGHLESECVVRVRYKPSSGGPTVYTKLVEVKLPGISKEQETKPLVEHIERRESPKMEGSTISLASKKSIKDYESNYQQANVERAQHLIHSKLQQLAADAKVDTQVQSLPQKSRATRVQMRPANDVPSKVPAPLKAPAPFVLDLTEDTELRHIDEANTQSETLEEATTTIVEHPLTAESFKQPIQHAQRHPLLEAANENAVPVDFKRPVQSAEPVFEHPLRKHPLDDLENSTTVIEQSSDNLPQVAAFDQREKSRSSLAATSPNTSSFWKLRPAENRRPKRLSREPVKNEVIETFDFDDPAVTHVTGQSNSNSRRYDGVEIDEATPDADYVERSSHDTRRFRSLAR